MFELKTLRALCGALALLAFASSAHAYDLSRAYPAEEKTERGFVHFQGALWAPAFGSFSTYHQLSLDFGVEVGFRVLSLRGEHNFYVVVGGEFSPQTLDPDATGGTYDTNLVLGYAGVRYIPSALCTYGGTGCLFFELRFGLTFEEAEDGSGHDGPSGDFTVLPGVGYRFRFGAFQLGVRADASFTHEYEETLGWVALGGFLGFGW